MQFWLLREQGITENGGKTGDIPPSISATSGGCTFTLTIVSSTSCQCSIVTVALKCTVFELEARDRQTDGRTDRSIGA